MQGRVNAVCLLDGGLGFWWGDFNAVFCSGAPCVLCMQLRRCFLCGFFLAGDFGADFCSATWCPRQLTCMCWLPMLRVCRYSSPPRCYEAAFEATKAALAKTFFGPVRGGVFSPSVQFTLFQMGKAAIER